MPLKYKPLIPLLEGEQLDYTNQARIEDDVLANGISYFNASTSLFGTENEAYCKVNNVAKAKSCYELTSKGANSDDPMTCGVLVLKNVESSTINITKCVAGRYECRVLLPKENGTTFCIKLLGQYGNEDYAFIQMQTPYEITNSEADINNCIEISARVRNGTSKHKEVQITKNLNDGNFHTLGFDWYCSTNNKKINFYIDNTFIDSIDGDNVPNTPMKLYIGAYPSNNLPLSNYFDTDYVLIDYIRYIPFVNQEGITEVTLVEDTKVGEITLTSNRDYPRIINTKNSNNELQVVSTFKKDSTGKIVSKLNTNGNNWTLDTNGNRNGYSYGNNSNSLDNKLIIPTSLDATVDNKKANYPVIQSNARARLKSITGNSIVWNQLCPNFKETINGKLLQCWYQDGGNMTITEENGEQVATLMAQDPTGATFRLRPYTASAFDNFIYMRNLPTRYHKVLFKFDARAEGTDAEGWNWGDWYLYISGYDANNPRFPNTMKSGEWTTFTYIQEMTLGDMVACFFNPSMTWASGIAGKNIGYSMRRVMIFDLTLMFGKGNEPTIEEFNRLFPNTYYPWVAEGELRKTTINSIKSYDKDGTELDSIDKLANIDLISATTNSKYHQSIEVSNNINLSAYTYDGAETYKIDKISNVSDKDLSTLGFNSSTNNENVYSVWNDSIDSCYSASDYPPTGGSPYDYPYAPILSNKYNNGISSRRIDSPADNTTYNKFISFGGNENTFYIKDNSITTDMKLYLNNIKGKTMKYTQLISVAGYPSNQTISGVTFTFNKTTGEILVNGTATADIVLKINDRTGIPFVPTSVLCLKGCPSGGSTSTYYLAWVNADYRDVGNGNYSKFNTHMSITDTTRVYLSIQIIIKSGTVMNNKRFYPQLFNVSDMYGLGKEPKTIADFNKDFPHSFYPYSNREIRSVAIKQISIKPGYKNLCDKDKFKIKTTYTHNGLTMTNNNDGTVTINGTSTASSVLPIQDIEFDTSHIYYASPNLHVNYGLAIDGGNTAAAIIKIVGTPIISNKFSNGVYYSYPINTTVNNVTYTPQLIDLTLTYGAGNEPKTLAQFNQDFPDIDNIPYPEQTISFAEQTLYGINDVQDTLQVVKENNGYKLQRVENIGNVDLGTLDYAKSTDESLKYFRTALPDAQALSEHTIPNILCSKYITDTKNNVWGNFTYNLTIGAGVNPVTQDTDLDIRDDTAWKNNTIEEFKTSLNGQILYYAKRTPITTTLYSLTPSNVAALFAKGYYIEVVGNDTNKDIIRPDVTVNIPCLNGTSYIDKEITFTNLDKEAIDGKMTGLKYSKGAVFRKELQGIHAYYGAKDTTTTELYSGLSFEDVSLQIAEGGYIEVDYTGVQPNVSFDFPVQLYKIYEASYGKVDVVALDSQLQNAKYNTLLQLNNVKGRSVKWTQLINPEHFSISQTINGMTFTVDKTKGTITCNGTTTAATSLYVANETSKIFQATPNDIICLKGCPSGGSASTYYLAFYGTTYNDFGSGVYDKLSNRRTNTTDTINTSMAIAIEIASGVTMTNKVFRPQLFNVSNIYGLGKEPKTITDFNKDYPYSIYPYGKQEILTTKVSGIKIRAGYKNLITYFEPTTTISGVTITNNNDGTFTCNGTASADINFRIANAAINMSVDTTFIMGLLKGCPSGGSLTTYYLCNTWTNSRDYGQGAISRIERAFPTTIYLDMNVFIKQGTVCNNLVFKPQLINLNDVYENPNQVTPAQFNQDFPDIDNIPYPEQTISFAEQTLYGINDVQDTLQVVKENNGYKLQRVENIGNVDLGTLDYAKSTDESLKYFRTALPDAQALSEHTIPNILCSKYITDTKNNVWGNFTYNLTIGAGVNPVTQDTDLDIRDDTAWKNNTIEEFKTSLNGQILYYAKRTPTTTTLATLTKNQVTALFAKGYCVEILGNDDNKIIVRPDLTINYSGEVEEIITQSDDTDSEVVE